MSWLCSSSEGFKYQCQEPETIFSNKRDSCNDLPEASHGSSRIDVEIQREQRLTLFLSIYPTRVQCNMSRSVFAVCACLCVAWCLRGVSPDHAPLYQHSHLLCDGDTRVSLDRVNDDFCDCPLTGLDEPGTSACSLGTFFCANRGSRSKFVPSGYVGDGVCGKNRPVAWILTGFRLLRWL